LKCLRPSGSVWHCLEPLSLLPIRTAQVTAVPGTIKAYRPKLPSVQEPLAELVAFFQLLLASVHRDLAPIAGATTPPRGAWTASRSMLHI
jgi:hypothetical protein